MIQIPNLFRGVDMRWPPHLYLFVLSTAQNTQVPNGWWFELDLLYTKSGTDVFHTKSPSRDEVEARWGQR